MHSAFSLSALSGLALVCAQSDTVPVTGKLGDAEVVTNNPAGAQYVAVLPNSTRNTVRGSISAESDPSGTGVNFKIVVNGLPQTGGPFMYHIHDQPVPADGNCTATLAHQDPYIRGEEPPCDPTAPETCQTGDLSGKYGNIPYEGVSQEYTDLYASLVPGLGSFFGNRSIVIHYMNKTRITCANFEPVSLPSNLTTTTTRPPYQANETTTVTSIVPSATQTDDSVVDEEDTSEETTPASVSPAQSTGAASAGVWVSSGALLAAFGALML